MLVSRFANAHLLSGFNALDMGQVCAGICVRLIQSGLGRPILGVCLGMQAIGHAYGAAVGPAPEPVHGRLSQIKHSGHPLFSGIPSGDSCWLLFDLFHSEDILCLCDATPKLIAKE